MSKLRRVIVAVVLPLILLCTLPAGIAQATGSVAETIHGAASWYGHELQGRTTASGEPFDADSLTAAHRSLPFGTRIRVTNVTNGKSVVVTINDRGPFAGKRILDLSRKAAQVIGILKKGVGKVKIEVLERA